MNLLTGMAETIGELTAKDYESCDCLWPALLNSAPVVNDDHYQTNIHEELEVDAPGVLENDSDADGNSLIIVSHDTTTVIGGHVELNPDGSFNYIPPDGFVGEDSFTYTVTDGQEEGSGTVTVAVVDPENNAPVAMDDHYDIEIDTDLEVAAPGVLSNDSDPDGDTLTIIAHDTTTTIGGIVTLNPDGSFKYTPPSDTTGVDTFTYIIGDPGGKRDTAEVSITIKEPGTPHNSPPNAEDDDLETDLDSELIITDPSEGVLENDSDPDGDEITVQEVIDGITEQGGRINIHSDGTLSYIPRLGFIGTDSVEYTICDDQEPQLCDSAMIYIVVNELPIEVYSAFSPNGDGVNDSWIIQGITRFPDNVVQILNRWGNLIFEVAGYDNTTKVWNGNASKGVVFGGSEAPDGAYYYIIDLGDGSERLSGYVVIRS
jgi:gliding motility-associated-like protein